MLCCSPWFVEYGLKQKASSLSTTFVRDLVVALSPVEPPPGQRLIGIIWSYPPQAIWKNHPPPSPLLGTPLVLEPLHRTALTETSGSSIN